MASALPSCSSDSAGESTTEGSESNQPVDQNDGDFYPISPENVMLFVHESNQPRGRRNEDSSPTPPTNYSILTLWV